MSFILPVRHWSRPGRGRLPASLLSVLVLKANGGAALPPRASNRGLRTEVAVTDLGTPKLQRHCTSAHSRAVIQQCSVGAGSVEHSANMEHLATAPRVAPEKAVRESQLLRGN